MTTATEKQTGYLADLVQIELINTRRSIAGLSSEQAHKLADDAARRVRTEIETGVSGTRASELIDAVKGWGYGPKKLLKALGYTQEQIKQAVA